MKLSVSLSTAFEGVMYPVPFASADDFIRQAKRCEDLGYHSVWGNDHITTQDYVRELYPENPPAFFDPMIVFAAVAAVTTTLKFGTALTVLPMHEPVYLTKQAITLDQISGGRFIMAVGLGAYREEFLAWGGTKAKSAHRGTIMDESLEAINLLLTERSASFDGQYVSFTDVEMYPKSIAQPFPLYVGGHNLEAVRRVIQYGQGWLPGWRPFNELAERITMIKVGAAEIGRDPNAIEIAPQFSVTVGKTLEEAENRYMQTGLVAHRKSLSYTGRDLSQQVTANLVGSPDVILEKIAELKAIGVDHCSALMFPADSVTEMDEQIEWFAKDVLPYV